MWETTTDLDRFNTAFRRVARCKNAGGRWLALIAAGADVRLNSAGQTAETIAADDAVRDRLERQQRAA